MSKNFMNNLPPLPARKELSDNPVKLCNEIARIFRTRMRDGCDIDGVMSQPGARLVLSVLSISDGLSQRELAERTYLKPPSVSVIIRKMLDEGMIELRTDEADMRINRVYLTDYGRETDEENIRKIKSIDARGLRGINETESDVLMELLIRIRDNLLLEEDEQ